MTAPITTNDTRQPAACPSAAVIGIPMRKARLAPELVIVIPRAICRLSTRAAVYGMATPQVRPWSTPPSTRSAARVAYPASPSGTTAHSRLVTANSASTTTSSGLRGSLRVAIASGHAVTATVTAKMVSSGPTTGSETWSSAAISGSSPVGRNWVDMVEKTAPASTRRRPNGSRPTAVSDMILQRFPDWRAAGRRLPVDAVGPTLAFSSRRIRHPLCASAGCSRSRVLSVARVQTSPATTTSAPT